MSDANENVMTCFIAAKNDEEMVKKDTCYSVKPFIRDHLFYLVIHLFKHMEAIVFCDGGSACKLFIRIGKRNDGKDGNPHMNGASEKEWEEYFKFLWMRAACKKVINMTMNMKRSNVFSAFNNAFNSKFSIIYA